MKARELAAELLRNPELDVCASDLNSSGIVWSISFARVKVAGENEYPDDYNMPAGYTYIKLS